MRTGLGRMLLLMATAFPIAASAQVYDPASGASPLTLLAAPRDGLDYYETLQRARALHAEEKWAEAEPLWARLAREYPRDSENWTGLAEAREALKNYTAAAEARKTAGALAGWDGSVFNGYYLAMDYARAGNKRAALDTLKWMIHDQHGIRRADLADFPQFDALRGDPEFLALIGRVDTSGWTRVRGWLYDIDYLRSETKRLNPEYRDKPLPAEFERRYAKLKQDIAKLSDQEIYFGMLRMLAPLGQGHVYLFGFPNDRYLPLRLYAFPEGIFIIDADNAHSSLVGARVLTIGKLSAEEAARRLAEAQSVDGPMQYLWAGVPRLADAANLKGVGAIETVEAVTLSVRDRDGKSRSVKLETTATRPAFGQADRPDKLLAPAGVVPPLFLSDPRRTFWERALPEHDALYVQVNNILNGEEETLRQFGNRIGSLLDQSKPRNLILDLRHNNGGNTTIYPELLRSIIAFSKVPGSRVYALIGRRTYSATANFITDLERLADPVFVGEASSECCYLYGDPGTVVLPYSKIRGDLTATRWQLGDPFDRRREMSPQIPVQLTAAAYFSGQDPALDAVFKHIAKARASAR